MIRKYLAAGNRPSVDNDQTKYVVCRVRKLGSNVWNCYETMSARAHYCPREDEDYKQIAQGWSNCIGIFERDLSRTHRIARSCVFR